MAESHLNRVRREEAKTWRFVVVLCIIYAVGKWLI